MTAEYLNDLFGIEGQTAVVIGGAGVLGGALCRGLQQAGAHVHVADLTEEACQTRMDELRQLGGTASFSLVNVTSRESIEKLLAGTLEQTGRADILVNCAGVNAGTDFLDATDEDWDRILTINLRAVFQACQVFGRHMVQQGGGAIVNIGSVTSHLPLSRVFAYSASKAGVLNLTRNIANDFGTTGVRVNCICPGFFPAEQNRKVLTKERVAAIMAGTSMNRYGEPEELIGALLLLVAPKAGQFITGTHINVDGGFTAAWLYDSDPIDRVGQVHPMSLYFAEGSPETSFNDQQLQAALTGSLNRLGPRAKVLALPADFTRFNSMAGKITCMVHGYFGERLTDVMPALGTHYAMQDWQLQQMFPGLPKSLIREHKWREDVVTVGTVPPDFVKEATEGIYDKPWPAQLNRLLWEGGHDLILSIGQVVPHEVIGMANHNKNIFVGTGGAAGINESHFIGAAYGMERMMGRADTPLRRILNYAAEHFCRHLPVVYVLTVVGPTDDGGLALRGLFIGDDNECFEKACELALQVNFTVLDEEPDKMVVYLDPEEFHSTWLGNKAIYRTRMAIADDGELIVLGPAVKTFGEDPQIDRMIRKYGYRTTPEIMQFVQDNDDLADNLSAAAHLIHGSSEGRFGITYCPGMLTREEIEGVGYAYADLDAMLQRYRPGELQEGWNTLADGQRIFFIRNPALGLWAYRGKL